VLDQRLSELQRGHDELAKAVQELEKKLEQVIKALDKLKAESGRLSRLEKDVKELGKVVSLLWEDYELRQKLEMGPGG